jgi:hypothetical protein
MVYTHDSVIFALPLLYTVGSFVGTAVIYNNHFKNLFLPEIGWQHLR